MFLPSNLRRLSGVAKDSAIIAAVTVGMVLSLPLVASARPGQRGAAKATRPSKPATRPTRPSARPTRPAARGKRTVRTPAKRPNVRRPTRPVRPNVRKAGAPNAHVNLKRAPRTATPNIKRPKADTRPNASRPVAPKGPTHAGSGHAAPPSQGFKKHNPAGKRKFRPKKGTVRPK